LTGNPVDLESITFIEIALWAMTPDEFARNWEENAATSWQLDADDRLVMFGRRAPAGEPHGTLLDLELHSDAGEDEILSYFDPVAFPPQTHVYTLLAGSGDDARAGTRMLGAFVLDEDSDETELHLDSSSAQLTYSVDL